jgi:hypothetical protein
VFLYLKGLSAKARDVCTELAKALASDAIACSSVTKDRRNHVILQNEPEIEKSRNREVEKSRNREIEKLRN